jgi:hypothetical protein
MNLMSPSSGQMMETAILTAAVRISDPHNYATFILYSFTVIMVQRNEKHCNLAHTKPQTALLPYSTIHAVTLNNFFG